MLELLPNDIIRVISTYLTPPEFKTLHESMNDESLNQFTIQCTSVISVDLLHWFQSKQIRVELWRREATIGGIYFTQLNGLMHSFDDKPSKVTSTTMQWHRHGLLHRDHGQAAVVTKISDNEWMDVSWFEDGIFIRSDCHYLPQYQMNA